MKRVVFVAACLMLTGGPVAIAQEFPARNLTMIVPYPPGGVADMVAREVADRLAKKYSRSVVVDNRAGASGNIGTEFVARAKPDGYTLVLTTNAPLVLNKYFISMPFDPFKDLQPIAIASEGPTALVVAANLPVKTLPEFLAYAKANPGKLSYASSGVGTPHHFDGEYLKDLTGIDMAHVPYRGATPAVNDLIAGQVPVGFITYGTILPFVNEGKAKVLGLVGDTRSSLAPDVPLIRDHVPGFVSAPNGWHAILAPAGTPPDIVAKLNKDINEALSDPEMKKRIAEIHYYETVGGTPQDLVDKMRKETEISDRLAEKMGIKK